eukprot:8856690-Pyramimonas_sp.AAC.1
MCPGGCRPCRIPYLMTSAVMSVADPRLELYWRPDLRFLTCRFLVKCPPTVSVLTIQPDRGIRSGSVR